MGHHLTDHGAFKSDKYDWCPEGFFALKFTDPHARAAIFLYAMLETDDDELCRDLALALQNTGTGMMPDDIAKRRRMEEGWTGIEDYKTEPAGGRQKRDES